MKGLGNMKAAFVAASVVTGLVMSILAPGVVTAASGPIFTVMNTSETLPDGVYFRNSPNWSDTSRTYGLGVFMNEQVQLECYVFGQAIGPYNNALWYYVLNVTRPINYDGQANQGMLDAHYINDNEPANVVDSGVPGCVNNLPPPPPPPPYVTPCVYAERWSSIHLTFSYSGLHRYYGNAWQAAANWTALNTGITISPAPSGSTGNIVFQDVYWAKNANFAHTQLNPVPLTGPFNSIPTSLTGIRSVVITVNQYAMDAVYPGADSQDFIRTYALTHELGHALGLAHSNLCGAATHQTSIMAAGGSYISYQPFNTPQYYDKLELEELYGLPTG